MDSHRKVWQFESVLSVKKVEKLVDSGIKKDLLEFSPS